MPDYKLPYTGQQIEDGIARGIDLDTMAAGSIPMKDADSVKASSLTENGDRIVSEKDVEVPPDTIWIGEGTGLSGAVRAVSLKSEITGNTALVLAQLFDETGFKKAFAYEGGAAQDLPFNNPEGASVANTAAFSRTTTADELLIGFTIKTNKLNVGHPIEITIKSGDSSGAVAFHLKDDIVTGADGSIFLDMRSHHNPILIDNLEKTYIEINCEGMLGKVTDGVFVPNLVVKRIIVTRKEIVLKGNTSDLMSWQDIVQAADDDSTGTKLDASYIKNLPAQTPMTGTEIIQAIENDPAEPKLPAEDVANLTKTDYAESDGQHQFDPINLTMMEILFQGTGTADQTMPNIVNCRDMMLLMLRNVKTDDSPVTLLPANSGQQVNGASTFTLDVGVSALFVCMKSRNDWHLLLELDSGSTPVVSGITLANATSDIADVTKINVPTSEILAKGGGEVDLIPYITLRNVPAGQEDNLAKEVHLQPPLKTFASPDAQEVGQIYIDPRAYEAQHAASCLLQLDNDLTLRTGRATKLYTPHEIVPTGEYYSLNQQVGGVNVQDNTGGDTAVTGGELTRIMGSVSFYGKATADCNVKLWMWYKDPATPIAGGILQDVNNHPMMVERHYNQGDSLEEPLVVAGAMMATGQAPVVMYVEVSDGDFVVNPDQTLMCIEQFSDGYEVSLASVEFQRRLGIELHAEIKQFTSKMLSMKDEILGRAEPLAVIQPNQGYDFLNEFGVQNLTVVQASIENDALNISDNGNVTDFYVDIYIDNVKTRMLRGREIDYDATLKNTRDAYALEVYKWTGKADQAGKIYSSRNNGSLILNEGFELVKSKFITEQPDGQFRGYTDNATVPGDANNLFIIIRPITAQSPLGLSVKEFSWGSADDFRGYVETSRVNLHEQHLWLSEAWAEFGLNVQGFEALRYTINNTPSTGNPMPVGLLLKGKAPVELDNSVNKVSGSMDPKNDGAIKFTKDGEAKISKSYNVWNEQGTDNTVTFWDVLIDVDGVETKIPDSEKTFTVPKNTGAPGIVYSIPAYNVEVETGQRVGGRATSNVADGAYVQTQNVSEYIVMTTIDFEELIPDAGDDPTTGVDLSAFSKFFATREAVSYVFVDQSQFTIDVTIPEGVEMAVLGTFAQDEQGVIRPVKSPDYRYVPPATQGEVGQLIFDLGRKYTGEIILEFLS